MLFISAQYLTAVYRAENFLAKVRYGVLISPSPPKHFYIVMRNSGACYALASIVD